MQTEHTDNTQSLRWIRRKPDGGFALITGTTLLSAWWALIREMITIRDLRVWLACFELVERRSAAPGGRRPFFTEAELARVTGIKTVRSIRAAIRRLEAAGMLFWSAKRIEPRPLPATGEENTEFADWVCDIQNHARPVPVPRRMIVILARCSRRAITATVFAHLLRCMYYRGGRVISGGRCKATWVAETFALHERTIKTARRELLEQRWLIPRDSPQHMLNRWGPAVVVNLMWGTKRVRSESPPRQRRDSTGSPRPIGNKELSSRLNDQKPASGQPWCPTDEADGRPPTLRRLTPEDLKSPARLQALFDQANATGLVGRTEARRLDFFAAAEHALRVAERNNCGLFFSIIRNGWWHHISQEDEDHARAKLRSLDDGPRRCPEPVAA
jgi:hypothetical protein